MKVPNQTLSSLGIRSFKMRILRLKKEWPNYYWWDQLSYEKGYVAGWRAAKDDSREKALVDSHERR